MNIKNILQVSVAAAAIAMSGAASATTDLTNQYNLSSFANQVDTNEYVFTYVVKNLTQNAGSQTGLDGFTIYIPDSAVLVTTTHPKPATGVEHSPGYWSESSGSGLNLGGNGSQNLSAPAGYTAYTWWGQDPTSVYGTNKTASFSITLDNVTVGTNTVGISTYMANGTIAGQAYAHNQYGNYSTFTANAVSAIAAVPEPETYAMLLAGLGLMGFVARRRKNPAA